MGIAILSGILSSLSEASSPSAEDTPKRLPSKFIACVRRPESAKKIKLALANHSDVVSIAQHSNAIACSEADVVLLGCKPYMVKDILEAEGMKDALAGKLLISICAGLSVEHIQQILYPDVGFGRNRQKKPECTIVRAMPNTASGVRESMTVIATSTPPLATETSNLVTWIFKRIGEVAHLPEANMDASTALCGSGPAFFALMMEAAIDGAVAMGLPRAEAQKMAAQTMKGTAAMVLAGEHPALLKDKVSTPGGCTIGGLMVLEEGTVRGTVARAIREATVVAAQLGNGVKNVNGTRF